MTVPYLYLTTASVSMRTSAAAGRRDRIGSDFGYVRSQSRCLLIHFTLLHLTTSLLALFAKFNYTKLAEYIRLTSKQVSKFFLSIRIKLTCLAKICS